MRSDSKARARHRAASALCRTTVRSVERPETILVYHDGYAQARPLVDQIARSYLYGVGVRIVDCWELGELAKDLDSICDGKTLAQAIEFVDEAMDLRAHLLVSARERAETVLLHALRASALRRRPVVVVAIGSAELPASLDSAAADAGALCLTRAPNWLPGETVSSVAEAEAIDGAVDAASEEKPEPAIEGSQAVPEEDEWIEIKSGSRVTRVKRPKRAPARGGGSGGMMDTGPGVEPGLPGVPRDDVPPPSGPAKTAPVRTDSELAAKRMEQIERIRRQAGEG